MKQLLSSKPSKRLVNLYRARAETFLSAGLRLPEPVVAAFAWGGEEYWHRKRAGTEHVNPFPVGSDEHTAFDVGRVSFEDQTKTPSMIVPWVVLPPTEQRPELSSIKKAILSWWLALEPASRPGWFSFNYARESVAKLGIKDNAASLSAALRGLGFTERLGAGIRMTMYTPSAALSAMPQRSEAAPPPSAP